MQNEKQADVLTEEELTLNEKALKNSSRAGAMYATDYNLIEDIIDSHRTLNSRNAKLVHENDELMTENEKLKAALIRERDDALIWDGITVVNRINKILEELNHE